MKEPNIKDELKGIAPDLNTLDRDSGFALPPDYFNQMQVKVMSQIREESVQAKPARPQGIIIRMINSRVALVAASFAAFVIALVFLIPTDIDAPLLSNLSSDDAYDYIYENIDDFETEELLSYAETENIDLFFERWSEDDMKEALDHLFDENDPQIFDDIDLENFE